MSHAIQRTHDRPDPLRGPGWVPEAARHYLSHVENGAPIRVLARASGCHASTILRQIRRFETRRDDPLVDSALRYLGALQARHPSQKVSSPMTVTLRQTEMQRFPDEVQIEREARRILRRLTESGAVLAAAKDMEKAVVVRECADGRTVRTAVLDLGIAQAIALKDWIKCSDARGRISRYEITAAGRAALKRLLAEDQRRRAETADADADNVYADQHREWEEDARATREPKKGRVRYNLAESPLTLLGRRREKDGKPFLSPDLVSSGERLREDFELAQMGPNVTQNWEKFLTGGDRGGFRDSAPSGGPEAARARVAAALKDLGPGLGDVALRCCCFLEGMETTEKRLGWSARSGKIVLRIALQRLKRHYETGPGAQPRMIG